MAQGNKIQDTGYRILHESGYWIRILDTGY